MAATVALPGRGGAPSSFRLRTRVETGGRLDVDLHPVVAAAGCRHTVDTDVQLATDARLRWREEVVLGRYSEPPGVLRLRTRVDVAAAALLRSDLALGPDPVTAGPAVLGAARAYGSELCAGPGTAGCAAWTDDGVVVLPLAGPGVVVTALGDDLPDVRRRLDAWPTSSVNRLPGGDPR